MIGGVLSGQMPRGYPQCKDKQNPFCEGWGLRNNKAGVGENVPGVSWILYMKAIFDFI